MTSLRRGRLLLRLRPGFLAAEAVRGRQVVWAGEAAWEGPADLTRVLAEVAATPELGRDFRALSVVVERPLMQLRRLTDLPPVRQATLKTLVRTHAARYFRRNGTPLVTDAKWIAADDGRTALLCAMEVSLLEALAGGAQAAGLRLVSVTPAEGYGLSLLPPSTQVARFDRLRRTAFRWGTAAAAAWGLVGASYLLRLSVERRRVERELLRLEEPAAALRALRIEMRTAEEMTTAVAAAERAGHDVRQRLESVAAAVPDSAFLSSLTLSAAGNGTATGYAHRAAEVAASFERAPGVRSPRLEGRLTREVLLGREWDRFTISFGDSAKPGGRRGGG